ncbi:hypothetical protein LIER_37015 [Lithospermum erythrorhizon]|uniref:Uncharacterized protein n=1 Tax=Lithospermum erythrorhizon TaxID=34254 RepID=A0AAV3PF57_LITER
MVNAPIMRLVSFKVVYGLWIKAPLEKSWIEFKLVDESMVQPNSMEGRGNALFLERREENEGRPEKSRDPIFSPNRLQNSRDEELRIKLHMD